MGGKEYIYIWDVEKISIFSIIAIVMIFGIVFAVNKSNNPVIEEGYFETDTQLITEVPQLITEELNQTNGCIENWNCTEWSGCIGNERTRNCNDLNDCGTTVNKMIEIESCECVEEWECTNWSKCYEGDKVRVCSDKNKCGTMKDRPVTSSKCRCNEDWSCGQWSECSDGSQKRACNDENSCGTSYTKPSLNQTC